MYFDTKNYLKNNSYHTIKHLLTLNAREGDFSLSAKESDLLPITLPLNHF
jgi:hypothetical protein